MMRKWLEGYFLWSKAANDSVMPSPAMKEEKITAREILVNQQKWNAFEIGDDQPYQIYVAAPLLSCSAYIFKYTKPNGKEMRILYHVLSGEPTEFDQIVKKIQTDGVELKNVQLEVKSSDKSNQQHFAKVIESVTSDRNKILIENHFPIENCKVENAGFSYYCVDNRGAQGLNIKERQLESNSLAQRKK